MDKIRELEGKVEEIISESPAETDVTHSKSTRDWVIKLKPDADYALQIAALAHDIDRGFIKVNRGEDMRKEFAKHEDFTIYDEVKIRHSKRGADIIYGLLEEYGFNESFRRKVKHLVECHEFGGDPESDILRDADSLSFFKDNLEFYFGKLGSGKTRSKIKFMYDRMSERARGIVKGFEYNNRELNSIFKDVVSS